MFLVRGLVFSHEAVREWEASSPQRWPRGFAAPARRGGPQLVRGRDLHQGPGRWCYLYRAIDRSGALVDVLFSGRRDMAAAKAFFRSARAVTGVTRTG